MNFPSSQKMTTVASAKARQALLPEPLKESSTFSGLGQVRCGNNNEQGGLMFPGNSDKFKLPLPRIIITIVPQLFSDCAKACL